MLMMLPLLSTLFLLLLVFLSFRSRSLNDIQYILKKYYCTARGKSWTTLSSYCTSMHS